MTKYYVDSEFLDTGQTIDLISIGIVCEDGREYYAQSVEFDPTKASEWVRSNVLTHLDLCLWAGTGITVDSQRPYMNHIYYHKGQGQCVDQQRGRIHNCPWRTRKQIRRELITFMDVDKYGKPELRGWCAGYDHIALCQLFGTMMDIPDGWPHYICELQQILDMHSITDDILPNQVGNLHNALEDARHIRHLWEWIKERYG